MDSFLSKDKDIPLAQQNFIIKGIEFILTHNFLPFNDKIYLQMRGTAMGTRFARSYANLFMGYYESRYIQNPNPWAENIKLYRRYIDDLFFVWDGN